MENKAMSALVEKAKQQPNCDLSAVFGYRLTDECLSIFNTNGTIRKCQKSKLVEEMKLVPLPIHERYIVLIDMGFIWRLSTPTHEDREKNDESDFTWSDWAKKVYDIILSRHPKASMFLCVNDPYDEDIINIKDCEHAKRSIGDQEFISGSKNIYPHKDKFPSAREFQYMFTNPANKRRLQEFLKSEFTNLCQQQHVKFIYSVRERCDDISQTPTECLENLQCHHTEVDTILLFIYSQLRKEGFDNVVVIDAEDTDVVVLCAYAAHLIPGILGLKRKGNFYDCQKLCSKEIADVIVPFHASTGTDAVSSFFGKGKKQSFIQGIKAPHFHDLISSVGQTLPVSEETVQNLQKFTVQCIYSDQKSGSLAECREKKWTGMKRKSTQRLPPDNDSHDLRAQRVNYQAYVWLNFESSEAPPSPLHLGWVLNKGMCVPERYTRPALPPKLIQHDNNNEDDANTSSYSTSEDYLSDSDDTDADSRSLDDEEDYEELLQE